MDKYTVLMSVYIKEKPEYLSKSIDSMLNQTIKPDEFIIVEDGPLTNELYSVLNKYEKENNIIKRIRLEKNGGLGNALNIGLKQSKNELVARMDSDDISLSDRCEKELKCFEQDDELVIVGGQIDEFVDTTDNVISSRNVPLSNEEIKKFARRRSPFNHPTVMYKRSKVLDCGGYTSSGRKEDLDLFLAMVFAGYKCKNINETLLFYRAGADNLQRRKNWNNCKEYIEVIYKYYKKGFIKEIDLIYVILGQMILYISPKSITSRLNNKFLRIKRK